MKQPKFNHADVREMTRRQKATTGGSWAKSDKYPTICHTFGRCLIVWHNHTLTDIA